MVSPSTNVNKHSVSALYALDKQMHAKRRWCDSWAHLGGREEVGDLGVFGQRKILG